MSGFKHQDLNIFNDIKRPIDLVMYDSMMTQSMDDIRKRYNYEFDLNSRTNILATFCFHKAITL